MLCMAIARDVLYHVSGLRTTCDRLQVVQLVCKCVWPEGVATVPTW